MENCKCFGCKPNLIPAGIGGNKCSICSTPLGAFPGVPFLGSVCVKCLDDDSLIHDPIYKVPFPKCSCGKTVHAHNYLFHGVLQPLEGHNVRNEDIKNFRDQVSKIKSTGK